MTDIFSLFRTSFSFKIISMLGLTALADFLFYGHQAGWTIGLFGLLLSGVCVLHNSQIIQTRLGQIILLLTISQCFLQIEKASLLCFSLMSIGIVSMAILSQGGWKEDASLWARQVLSFILRILRPLNKALIGVQRYKHRYTLPNSFSNFIRGWFLPIVLSVVFIFLFASANPILTKWLSRFDFEALFKMFSFGRLFFWIVIAAMVFAVIRPKLKRKKPRPVAHTYFKKKKPMSLTEWAFTKEAVLRSLVIFNVMFACQTLMDMNYLWAGGALPDGITYAGYAQKGAYPLIVTALLAALFVLISQNAGKEVAGSKTVQGLIYLWVAQNILLVVSSIYRTGLYVEVYALTYLRVAAFIWMGLVACGLAWIIVRSILNKSNTWLINANVITALAVLYMTSFVNIGAMIAHYNVTHSKLVSGSGVHLDRYYMKRIGAVAIPAMEEYVQIFEKENIYYSDVSNHMTLDEMKDDLKSDMDDWRRWTYSEYRLLKSLEGKTQ